MRPSFSSRPELVAWGLALSTALLHLVLASRYGYHRDELYFIACGKRLAFGYVDHPPLVPWIASLAGVLFDHSLVGLRLLPALASAATVLLTARLARDFGGGTGAVLLAGLAVALSPAYLRMGGLLCIPVFEAPLWTAGSLVVVRLARGGAPRLWLAVGLVAGIGLLNKHSMLLWIAGLGAGVPFTPMRRQLRTPWPWLGGAIALSLAMPNLVWQAQHDWATVTFLRTMSREVLAGVPRSLFLAGQLLFINPLAAPLWLAGLAWLWNSDGGRLRVLAIAFVSVVVILLITRGKPYYLAPAFPPLLAAGGVWFETWLTRRSLQWLTAVATASLVAVGGLLALAALPILPLARIDAALGAWLGAIVQPEHLTGELHDQYGWREQAEAVARISRELPPEDRRSALVLTGNYGQAAAVELFGPGLGAPPVVSGHMSFHLWPPEPGAGRVVIALGLPRSRLEALFADVREVARIGHPLAWPGEQDLPVFVCRSPRVELRVAWPTLADYRHPTVRLSAPP